MARRHLTPAERVALALEGKQLAGLGDNQYRGLDPGSNPLESEELPEPVVTRQEVAKAAGVTPKTVDRAVTVLESGDEEVIDDMMSGRVGVKTAAEKVAAPRVSHNTGNEEWYTPEDIIEAARETLGTIELDPASSAKANEVVNADQYFTKEEDGLAQTWKGKVFMNPPFTVGVQGPFVEKLVNSAGVTEAVTLTHNNTETKWAQLLLGAANVVCFPSRRIRFRDETGSTPPGSPVQGQMVCGIGVDRDKFKAAFEKQGVVI